MDKPQVDNARKAKTGKSAVGLVVIAIMIVIIIAAIADDIRGTDVMG